MGGGEINLSTTAEALAKKGIEVNVLTSHFPGLKRVEKIDGVKIYRKLKTGKEPSGIVNNFERSFLFPKSIIKETKKLNQKLNPDLIHFIGTSIIAAKKLRKLRTARKSKIPFFATIESYPTLCPKGDRFYQGRKECKKICSPTKFLSCQLHSSEIGKTKNRWYLKYNLPLLIYVYNFYRRMNQSLKYCNLIAISGYVQKLLRQQGHESAIIPNALDINNFQIKRNKDKENIIEKNNKTNKLKILYLGSLTKFKGPQILLEAAKSLNSRLDFYGEGPLEEKMKKRIKEYKLDAEIHQNVPYEHIPEIYANCDLVVFPSLWPEPFGRIAIEGLAANKMVIGSDIGGIKETLQGKGILVKPGEVEELRKEIKKMMIRKIKMKNDKTLNNYKSETITKKLIEAY